VNLFNKRKSLKRTALRINGSTPSACVLRRTWDYGRWTFSCAVKLVSKMVHFARYADIGVLIILIERWFHVEQTLLTCITFSTNSVFSKIFSVYTEPAVHREFWALLNTLPYIVSRPVQGPTQPPIQWVPRALSLGLKRPEREADHSPPSSAEVKECVELYLHSPIRLHEQMLS
jgi:hypothetical protein